MKSSQVIIETDDDNIPNKYFFDERKVEHLASSVKNNGWVNIYDFFLKKKEFIWPRGIPLDELNNKLIHTTKKKIKNFSYSRTYVTRTRMLIQYTELLIIII